MIKPHLFSNQAAKSEQSVSAEQAVSRFHIDGESLHLSWA
jgi:hypothetical protein